MSVGKLWFRESTNSWYVKVDGKQKRMGVTREVAEANRNALLVEYGARNPSVADVVTLYLVWVKENRAESTYDGYKRVLTKLSEMHGEKDAKELRPADLTRWVKRDFPNVNETSQNDVLTMASAAWNWAERNHEVTSKIKKLDKPTRQVREFFVPQDRWVELLKVCSPEAAAIFEFMLHTGARPQEANILEAHHWHGNRFVLPPSQAKGKRQGRVIYVPDTLIESIEARVKATNDYVFKTAAGKPWGKNSFNSASRRVKKKMEMPKFCAYVCRHSFAADKVKRGVELAIVAKLMGHTSVDMVYKRYGHLAEQHDRLSGAINA